MHSQDLAARIVRQARKLLGVLRIRYVASPQHPALVNDNTPRFDRRRKIVERTCPSCRGDGGITFDDEGVAVHGCVTCHGTGRYTVDLSTVVLDVRAALAMVRGCGTTVHGSGFLGDPVVFDRTVIAAAVQRLWHAVQGIEGHQDPVLDLTDFPHPPPTRSGTDRHRRTILDADRDAEWRRSLVRTDG